MYNALWYFPVLMLVAGCAALVHDRRWLHPVIAAIMNVTRPRRPGDDQRSHVDAEEELGGTPRPPADTAPENQEVGISVGNSGGSLYASGQEIHPERTMSDAPSRASFVLTCHGGPAASSLVSSSSPSSS